MRTLFYRSISFCHFLHPPEGAFSPPSDFQRINVRTRSMREAPATARKITESTLLVPEGSTRHHRFHNGNRFGLLYFGPRHLQLVATWPYTWYARFIIIPQTVSLCQSTWRTTLCWHPCNWHNSGWAIILLLAFLIQLFQISTICWALRPCTLWWYTPEASPTYRVCNYGRKPSGPGVTVTVDAGFLIHISSNRSRMASNFFADLLSGGKDPACSPSSSSLSEKRDFTPPIAAPGNPITAPPPRSFLLIEIS